MKNPPTSPPTNGHPLWRRLPRWAWALIVVAAVLGGWRLFRNDSANEARVTFTARRGPLTISVIQGGSIEALESQEIRSEVRGYQGTKILKIVEEGYLVTDEDVATNKVLVELDSSELRQRLTTQETELESRFSQMIEARQAYEIQLGQNQADIKAAEQKVKFGRMDLDKFMGVAAAQELIDEIGLKMPPPPNPDDIPELEPVGLPAAPQPGQMPGNVPPEVAAQLAQAATAGGNQPKMVAAASLEGLPGITIKPTPPSSQPPPAARHQSPEERQREANSLKPVGFNVDFSKYADTNKLGDGTALQDLRKKQDEMIVAQSELTLAQVKLEGTERLFTYKFVTKTERDNEVLNVNKMRLRVDTADTALRLHKTYEFPKLAEETVSKYEEALRALDKAYKEAISKLAQAKARKLTAENRFELGKKEIQDIQEQIAKCSITAKTAGLVVYGGGNSDIIYYGQEQIREGATIRERQAIITIPDMSKMSVKLKIHESHIKKVKKDQRVKVTLDALPDEQLTGMVSKVGVLPDSQNRWMSPDMKVYLTTVNIEGTRDWVKPGMSAKVEILVNQLADAVYIPLQAVDTRKGKSYCHLVMGGTAEEREIVTGEFNDEFIEVKEGLKEGDLVMVRPPKAATEEAPEEQPAPAAPAAPAPQQQAALK